MRREFWNKCLYIVTHSKQRSFLSRWTMAAVTELLAGTRDLTSKDLGWPTIKKATVEVTGERRACTNGSIHRRYGCLLVYKRWFERKNVSNVFRILFSEEEEAGLYVSTPI